MITIFGQIIKGEVPCEKIYENEYVIAFHDIEPQAPVHVLIVPKKEIRDLQSIEESDRIIMLEVVSCAQQLAKSLGIEKGYRLVTNCGSEAGQSIFHLHFHLLGGKQLSNTLG